MGNAATTLDVLLRIDWTMTLVIPWFFGEVVGFDPITSTLIFGEYDPAPVDAMLTVAESEAPANWVALHKLRSRETDSIRRGE
jgi:hypothetical protein